VCEDALYGLLDLLLLHSDLLGIALDGGVLTDDLPEAQAFIDFDSDSIFAAFDECVATADIGI
jgi:hypothetical protein